jgi:hypothetical protein
MKRKYLLTIIALFIISAIISSCTRSASGSPTGSDAEGEDLPNPVSTQSQVMKDIIAGTKTAMAIPLDATEEAVPVESEETAENETTEAETTPEPEEEEEVIVLPTSTAGPPPEIALVYNADYCDASSDCRIISGQVLCTCILDYTKDQTLTVQVSNPFFGKGTDLDFLVSREGEYDVSKYILAGVAKYEPTGDGKNFFKAIVNIPDSLRGVDRIYLRINTENPVVYAENWFENN